MKDAARPRRPPDGLRPPRVPRRGPARPRAAPHRARDRRARGSRWPRRSRRRRSPSCKARKPDRVLATNVEFWSAVVLDYAGVPPDLFTPMFSCARVAGWSAHILEQKREGRLIRPTADYIGPARRASAEDVEQGDRRGGDHHAWTRTAEGGLVASPSRSSSARSTRSSSSRTRSPTQEEQRQGPRADRLAARDRGRGYRPAQGRGGALDRRRRDRASSASAACAACTCRRSTAARACRRRATAACPRCSRRSTRRCR